ncbi:MAG: hypothetical protein AMS19_03895 [Gemmatimonas sp. SG8_23]|nr:MAG: hypothetical protein AMS19_03895 [Gemmatimonas sp. SG8_23]
MKAPSGFTLAEVVVALVVLQIGVLGAMSLVVSARNTMTGAEQAERAVAVGAAIADSLSTERAIMPGEVVLDGVAADWSATGRHFRVRVFGEGGDTIVVVGSAIGDLRDR